ncbi:hypothetical protein [Mucilaginibacter segetis]|uniref:MipA/OmpV family protein n=1 Tax=Mucilaginibacter segetis TaxID=2793071 RepID=A0A934UMU6_9SPHI|nr:hypothetical protein [Mucilaginibacter segetis]MBK0379749.1 hypothetical protein [Mucilaginibacter segetis]
MRYFGLLFFILSSNVVNAKALKPGLYALRNTIAAADTDSVIRKNSISAGVSYGTDALFFGRTGPIKYPFTTADLILNYKSGFFIYGSVLKVLGYKPVIDELDLGGGYYYRLSSKFKGTLSYTRFFFNRESAIIKSSSSNDINFKNSYDWKYFKTSLTGDYLFGKSYDVFTTLSVSKYMESVFSIFNDQDFLSINPSVNMIIGTQNFVQRYSVDHEYRLKYDDIYLHNDPNETELDNARFRVLNYSFKLPLAYNTPHYTLEASYRYSIPVNVEGALKNRRESFFNLTFYYVLY